MRLKRRIVPSDSNDDANSSSLIDTRCQTASLGQLIRTYGSQTVRNMTQDQQVSFCTHPTRNAGVVPQALVDSCALFPSLASARDWAQLVHEIAVAGSKIDANSSDFAQQTSVLQEKLCAAQAFFCRK